jgi:RNA polymerase sigma factor (TIGR02999 family)
VTQADITGLLQKWGEGDSAALEKLVPVVYTELHRIAKIHMRREQPGRTLQTSALVNEAYLRLAGSAGGSFLDRDHFFAVSAQIMRRILVDAARERCAVKRGAGAQRVTLDKVLLVTPERDDELVALEEALRRLEHIDPRKARVVELRFFVGLNVEEIAGVLKLSQLSILRDWKLARAWLTRELNRADVPASVSPLGN